MGFNKFLKEILSLDEKDGRQAAADIFIKDIKTQGYPLIEDEKTAVLLYQGPVSHVAAIGDMSEWAENIPFTQIPGTDLFYLVLNLPKDARLEYLIQSNQDDEPGPDPLNPYIVHNGFGPNSELAMPGYERYAIFNEYIFGKKGEYDRLEKLIIGAGILPYKHEIYVYLPPGYDPGSTPYPSVYIQDGRDYIEFAITPVLIDDLIKSGKIKPVVAVFINPPNRHLPDKPNRITEYGMNDDYINFMADELVPFIEGRYHVHNTPHSRLVTGDSFGGLISAYTPFLRSDVFGLGYSQSGYQSFEKDRLIKAYISSDKKPVRLFVDVGAFEKVVGAGMLPDDETDFLAANRRFKKVLQQKGYDYFYCEYPEGHTWGNWRTHMADALIYFFGKGDSEILK